MALASTLWAQLTTFCPDRPRSSMASSFTHLLLGQVKSIDPPISNIVTIYMCWSLTWMLTIIFITGIMVRLRSAVWQYISCSQICHYLAFLAICPCLMASPISVKSKHSLSVLFPGTSPDDLLVMWYYLNGRRISNLTLLFNFILFFSKTCLLLSRRTICGILFAGGAESIWITKRGLT